MAVQFEVDEGTKQLSVTRLEMMIRDSDGFLGIYPFPGAPLDNPGIEELRQASRYFRLEIELASRASKPILVFADRRYRSLIRLPAWAHVRWYDPREIIAGELNPSRSRLQSAADFFKNEVAAYKQLRLSRVQDDKNQLVGIVCAANSTRGAYTSAVLDSISGNCPGRRMLCVT